jgi:hypothetical protein
VVVILLRDGRTIVPSRRRMLGGTMLKNSIMSEKSFNLQMNCLEIPNQSPSRERMIEGYKLQELESLMMTY